LKLSILMPAYNEAATVGTAVKRVLDTRYPCDIEVVIVNDGSIDSSREVLASIDDRRVVITEHPTARPRRPGGCRGRVLACRVAARA
jgi:glycosyltransferase involved in cell wall biosynthesis